MGSTRLIKAYHHEWHDKQQHCIPCELQKFHLSQRTSDHKGVPWLMLCNNIGLEHQ